MIMKKMLLIMLMSVMLIISSFGISACTKESNSFDDLPINITSSWGFNKEGYLCLYFNITNNSDKTIRDIQGYSRFTDYDCNGNIIGDNSNTYGLAGSLYLWDVEGNSIYHKTNQKIKPGETITLMVIKMPKEFVSYMYEARIYITWIDFVFTDNWGAKDLIGYESYIASKAPMVDVEPLYRN